MLREGLEARRYYDVRGASLDEIAYRVSENGVEVGTFRIRNKWKTISHSEESIARSCDCDNLCRIYCDGILVPGVKHPQWAKGYYDSLGMSQIILNIKRSDKVKLDLSRRSIAAEEQGWERFAEEFCVNTFRRSARKILSSDQSPAHKFYRLCRFFAYNNGVGVKRDEVILRNAPLLVIDEGAHVFVLSSTDLGRGAINVMPEESTQSESIAGAVIKNGWGSDEWLPESALDSWYGPLFCDTWDVDAIVWSSSECADDLDHSGRMASIFLLAALDPVLIAGKGGCSAVAAGNMGPQSKFRWFLA